MVLLFVYEMQMPDLSFKSTSIPTWQSYLFSVPACEPVILLWKARIQPLWKELSISDISLQPKPFPLSAHFNQGNTVQVCECNTKSGAGLAGIKQQCL